MAGKCPMCGAPLENNVCNYCGYSEKASVTENGAYQQSSQSPIIQPQVIINNMSATNFDFTPGISRKSKITALLLCIFLGGLGAHKFYVGKVGMGILYLFTAGFFGIGWFIDIFVIAAGAFKDEFGLPLRQ